MSEAAPTEKYLTVHEWVAFKDKVPRSDGAMIWWDDGEHFPRLVPSRDFCSEDKGYWMYPEQPKPRSHEWPKHD